MAETKTTTLAQIKMGTEKLTRTKTKDNTDIAAYKLPNFEKGSLILAKDTGNIYIDAPDETSRIHVGVGIATVNRGETFNNHYKFNLALSDSTHAEGYKTQAGYNYFEVKAIDVTNKKITLGDVTGLTAGMSYELFDFNTLTDVTRKITTGTISAISDKVITVDNLPENTDSDKLVNLRFTIPVNWGIVTSSKPALQHVFGNLQTGAGDQSHSEGIWNRALGFTSHVSGGYNTAYDSYSAIIGGTYGKAYGRRDLITGNYNTAYGNNTFICGTRNTAKASSAFVGGYYNNADYHYQSVLGLCNDNKESTLFEIGNGTYETKTDADGKAYIDITSRKNAFEVYLDGHAELQVQGTTDNSVVIKKYLNDTIASQVSSVYKAKGSIANISALAAPSKSYEGFVYNIETEFTTTANFIDGAGKVYPAGTNVVCINTTGTTYKWDVLAGVVDLSTYATTNALTGGLAKKQDKFADLDYVWDGDSFEYLTLSVNNAIKKTSTSVHTSIVSKLRLSTEMGNQQVHLTAGSFTVDPVDTGRYSSGLYNNFIMFKDRKASDRLYSMLITPTAHTGTTPAYLTLSSPAQNTAVGHANVRLTGIAAPTADSDAANKGYIDTNFQAKLVSGTNIKSIKDDKTEAQSLLGSDSLSFKTINNQSLLGSGNITIEGGGGTSITVDAELSKTSTNPVQNSVITTALYGRQILFADVVEMSILDQGTIVERIKELRFTNNGQSSDKPIDSVRFYNSSKKPVILHGISAGELDTDAVNISQLNKKQDALTSTTDLAIRSVTVSNVSTKLLQSGTDALQIVGSEVKLASNNKAAIKITNLADGTATSDAVNKGQLNTAVANKQDMFSTVTTTADETTLTADKPINITTNKYSMVYDDTNEAIKITFA